MNDFEKRLERAVERGHQVRQNKNQEAIEKALSEEELRRVHNEYRLELSEYIDQCISRLPQYLPGFKCQSIVGDQGWGSSCSRDDVGLDDDGTRTNFFSRLEVVVRPFGSHHVLDLAAKGTVRNKEVYSRGHYRLLTEVAMADFKEFVDLWIPEYVEIFAAS